MRVCVGGGGAERYYNIERFKRSREEQRLKTERDRQTERQTDRKTGEDIQRQTDRQAECFVFFLLLTNCM